MATVKPEQKMIPWVIRMPPDLYEAFKAKCQEDERSMARTLRYFARLYVAGELRLPG